ncbi:MAG: fasciclin domain-containing protein [Bacteroidaceae bacterium]|nr:fasciclin domain-containing protein [Bacteroidaceae bacterium]
MKKFFLAAFAVIVLAGCTEDIDTSAKYVFKDKTIAQYLEDKEYYSEYVRLLGLVPVSEISKTTVKQLLSARGHYTVFAPTNDAVMAYLDTLCAQGLITEPSWDGFTSDEDRDSIERAIVYNSILDSGDQPAYDILDFPEHEHEFGLTNMNDRKLRVFYGITDPDSILINETVVINKKNRGIILTNGYIHQVEGVIAPSNDRLGEFIAHWARTPSSGYSVMAKLVMACGLVDSLNAFRDDTWERMYLSGEVEDLREHTSFHQVGTIPMHRYYGFTLFVETDRLWEEALGKPAEDISVSDVCDFLRTSGLFDYIDGTLYDEDYGNKMNVLNQFVTYHLLNQRIGREKLVIHYNELGFNYTQKTAPSIPIMDFYQTMGLPRLLKTYESRESNGIFLNRFPVLRNGRGQFSPSRDNINDYHESGQFPQLKGSSAWPGENQGVRVLTYTEAGTDASSIVNGIVYPIDNFLVCTENVCNQMSSQRIRIDAGCMMPELMNNDIRSHRDYYSYGATNCRGIPTNYPYIENIEINEGTDFFYLPGYLTQWHNLQGDEYNIIGQYDFTMKLPPVPRAGQYEIRFGVATGSRVRSMAQVYFGTDRNMMPAAGIPMDLRMGGLYKYDGNITTDSNVGWEEDNGDEEHDEEVTKRMRTKGFMKAPNSWTNVLGGSKTVRQYDYMTRRIVVSTYLTPYQNYYIRFKSVLEDMNREFFMDYFEYVAKEVYDNPEEPEDIW